MNLLVKNIRAELKIYIQKNKIESLILGISGGIDSTLCAVLAKPVCTELGIKLYGRSISISTKSEETNRARSIGIRFCHDFRETNLTSTWYELAGDIYEGDDTDEIFDDKYLIQNGNIKARIRMIYLYNLASLHNGMVLSTDNYTEYLLGFWTLHGDVGDFGMIQNLWKTEVYDMVEWIRDNEFDGFSDLVFKEKEILSNMLKVDATDGLGISSTDLDQIMPEWKGTSRDGYKEVDKKLMDFLDNGTGDLDDPVIHRYLRTEFKRNNPINISRIKIHRKLNLLPAINSTIKTH